ncbi:alpha/beta fold hydrolase [Nocardia jejuensis]|uniref:alpha/beta fold hydrolase n=1 Tax=Nocardia jejuensis TaxID=328049 RepID=UPI00082A4902|nr:alpha/beta hydrolase [Nocardia jejuensis]
MPYISTPAGVRLYYDALGDPDGPPLVLVQGMGAQLLGWQPGLCARIAELGFRVVRFDNRDVGLSQKFPEGGYQLADMADDLAGLLTRLGIESAHIVGQSMGGMIAQELVRTRPDLVRTLALLYTAPISRDALGAKEANTVIQERFALPRARDRDEAIELYVLNEAPCASPAYPRDLEWLRELGGLMYDRDYDPDGAVRHLAAVTASPDHTEALRDIAIPTTILHGDGDRLIDSRFARVLHDAIPGSTLTVFPGMGHELPRALWPDIVTAIGDNAALTSPPGQ